MSGRRRGTDRRVVVLGVCLLALLLALAAVDLVSGDGGGSHTDHGSEPRVDAYRLLYRVEQRIDDPPVVTWEERIVQRPFRGRSATFRERPDHAGRPVTGVLTTAARVYSVTASGLQEVAGRVPGVPGGDQALAVVLDEAVARRLALPRGTRHVAGRSCRVYRLARPHHQPLGVFEPENHADVCIDGDGLLLHEEWTLDGALVQVRAAVEVDLSPPQELLERTLAATGAAPPAPQLEPPLVEPTDGRDAFLPVPTPPPGFRTLGAVRVVMPASLADPDAPRGTVLFTSVAWVFVRGPDVVTVEAGEGAPAWRSEQSAVRASLPRLGRAESVLGPDGAELRVELDGRWIRVRGTVTADALQAYAEGLAGPTAG